MENLTLVGNELQIVSIPDGQEITEAFTLNDVYNNARAVACKWQSNILKWKHE